MGKWQSYFLEQDGMFALDHQPAVFSLYLSKEPARKSRKLDEFSPITQTNIKSSSPKTSIPVFHWPNTDGCCCTAIQPGDSGCPLLMHVIVKSTYPIRTKYTRVLNYADREEIGVPRNIVQECQRGKVSASLVWELGPVKL